MLRQIPSLTRQHDMNYLNVKAEVVHYERILQGTQAFGRFAGYAFCPHGCLMPHRDPAAIDPSLLSAPQFKVLDEREDDLQKYLTALNANLQNYLRDGKTLNSFGARLSSGDGVFLLWFGSPSEKQTGMAKGLRSLDDATLMLASRLEGPNVAERAQRFLMDVRATGGDSPAVLIADNGVILYRPRIDHQQSIYEVSASDARSIARSII
jgi:hypothetical protein